MTKDAAGLTTATTQNFSTTSATQQPQQDANDIAQASSSTCPSPPSRSPSSSPLRPSQSTPQKRGVNGDYDPQDGALQVIDLGPVVTEIDDPDDLSDPLSNPLDAALQEEEAWDHDLKRVKVYELVGSAWVDQGTAFCCGSFQEDTGDALLIARAEGDHDNIILSTTIRPNDVYQRQQGTEFK
jgi:protein phosphatase-4 regulatory subunit 3